MLAFTPNRLRKDVADCEDDMSPIAMKKASLATMVYATAMSLQFTLASPPVSAEGATPDAPAAAHSSDQPIKIGLLAETSGAAGVNGQAMVNGFNLFLDQVHHQIAGRPVQLIIENVEGNPATAVGKLHKLVTQDKVDIVAGLFLSNVALAVGKALDQYKTPFLDGPASADELTQTLHPKWLVRTSFTASQPSHPLGEYAYKTLGMRKVITLGADYAYGYEAVGGFQSSFEKAGGHVVQKLWAPLGFMDFKPLLKQLRTDADGIFMVNVGQGAVLIPQQYKAMGFKMPIIASPTSFDDTLPKIGDAAIGAISCSYYTPYLDSDANQAFVTAFRKKYGRDPSFCAETTYVDGLCIQKAAEQLKGHLEDKEKLLSVLQNLQLENAPRGPLKIEHWNPIENFYVTKVVKVNGRLENKVIDKFANVSQFWTWPPDAYLKMPLNSKNYPPCTYCSSKAP